MKKTENITKNGDMIMSSCLRKMLHKMRVKKNKLYIRMHIHCTLYSKDIKYNKLYYALFTLKKKKLIFEKWIDLRSLL